MGNKGSKITAQDRAILDLKIQRDRLKQYRKKIQDVLKREQELAKAAMRQGDQRRALLALKKKKYQESLLEKTEAHLSNIEDLAQSIEFALVEKDVLAGLERGNDILKEIQKEISIERVEKIAEDTADAITYQQEVEDLLAGQITTEEEEEILQELRAMQLESLPAASKTRPVLDESLDQQADEVPTKVEKVKQGQVAMLET